MCSETPQLIFIALVEQYDIRNNYLGSSKIYVSHQHQVSMRHNEDELRCLDVHSQTWNVYLSVVKLWYLFVYYAKLIIYTYSMNF